MQPIFAASQWVVRICGVLLLLSGLLFWTGDAPRTLVPLHMLLGVILVVALIVLAVLGAQSGAPMGLAIGAVVLALVVLALGWTQTSLMPGGTHWIIQGLHLILGMAAVGIGEAIGGRVRRARLAPA
jgi:quinol-cytochrome oxidoreductase complex cytochrome b subunit